MDAGGPSPVAEEVLIPQLAWQMKNTSSMVQGSRAVTVYSQPGTYDPLTSRLIKTVSYTHLTLPTNREV